MHALRVCRALGVGLGEFKYQNLPQCGPRMFTRRAVADGEGFGKRACM